ncbi:AI-2E family transporter [Rhizobiaceae bacterium n13]|uniref:AI-2E family transporter n=1 Tax=Ferirhizobium litorale TaxID=2927786 RepID=A0AAE3QAS5_9HYPH|nr:AI-2E family transporter [Fererhizobium litorale]MDI7861304.1 AI-2E family transporter [Fererhizobium litorale]MDI7921451.1 AI-2E family transporter [Fererhizobium litorale]
MGVEINEVQPARPTPKTSAPGRAAADVEPPTIRIEKDGLDIAKAWCVIGIFMILGMAVIYLMAAVLMPITLAIVTGMILGMAADKLGRLGLPSALGAMLLTALVALVLFIIINALAQPLAKIAANAPDLAEQAMDRVIPYLEKFRWFRIASMESGPISMESLLEKSAGVLQVVAGGVTPALVQALIFLAALVLFLAGRLQLRTALIMTFPGREQRLAAIRILNAIERALGYYFSTATIIYAGIGLAMTVIAFVGGLNMPVLWGFFTFLSSFVPFLGVASMTVAFAAGGLMTHDTLILGLMPAVAFFGVHMFVENIITPAVMGRRLEINPFVVFVAIIFWTWMWGAVGAMLALPISLIVMTIIDELWPDERPMPQLPG